MHVVQWFHLLCSAFTFLRTAWAYRACFVSIIFIAFNLAFEVVMNTITVTLTHMPRCSKGAEINCRTCACAYEIHGRRAHAITLTRMLYGTVTHTRTHVLVGLRVKRIKEICQWVMTEAVVLYDYTVKSLTYNGYNIMPVYVPIFAILNNIIIHTMIKYTAPIIIIIYSLK